LNPNSQKKRSRDFGLYIFFGLLLIVVIWYISTMSHSTQEVDYSEVRTYFITDNVKSFTIKSETLVIQLRRPDPSHDNATEVQHELYAFEVFWVDNGDLIEEYLERAIEEGDEAVKNGHEFTYEYVAATRFPIWFQFIPYVLVIVVFIIVFNVLMNRAVGGSGQSAARFSKARTRLASEDKRKYTFADVAGADEEKAELQEVVDFLRNPKKYIELGARIPKGVLLVGPPGTGKTLIAKAVAGEAGVQFLSISGSDFVELYVGVGASRVRDLFDQAKKLAPAIIFIDEIDAVGRQRGAGLGGGHDEREQTLNQLLVEMDGFTSNEGVIIIAATNRSDILDSALLRPGRFDRQVYVGLPDIKGREEILKVHSRGKRFSDDVNLANVAKSTIGFTGADLENLLNEAALLAARENSIVISMADIEKATLKVIAGPEKKSRVVSENDRKLTAYHEAGHAVTSYFLPHVDPVHHVSIIPRGQAGGVTVYRPEDDHSFTTRSEMYENIISLLGGRISEKLFMDDISTGASNDIQRASQIARSMVMTYGMSDDLGPISFTDSSHSVFIGRDFSQTKSYSEKTAAQIDDAVHDIFNDAVAECTRILTENKDIVEGTVKYLLSHEQIDGDKFKAIVEYGISLRGGAQPVELPPEDAEF